MKKIFIITLCLLSALATYAQKDTTKIEQYCQLIATNKLLSNKVTVTIDFGEEKKFWSDTRLKGDDGKFRTFNTIIDAMNFMGRESWQFIGAYPARSGDSEIFHFAFKKLFYRSAIK